MHKRNTRRWRCAVWCSGVLGGAGCWVVLCSALLFCMCVPSQCRVRSAVYAWGSIIQPVLHIQHILHIQHVLHHSACLCISSLCCACFPFQFGCMRLCSIPMPVCSGWLCLVEPAARPVALLRWRISRPQAPTPLANSRWLGGMVARW